LTKTKKVIEINFNAEQALLEKVVIESNFNGIELFTGFSFTFYPKFLKDKFTFSLFLQPSEFNTIPDVINKIKKESIAANKYFEEAYAAHKEQERQYDLFIESTN